MGPERGVCTTCGRAVNLPHECSPELVRLVEIDNEAGPRSVREALIAVGQKGFNNKLETLEAEAATLRTALAEKSKTV